METFMLQGPQGDMYGKTETFMSHTTWGHGHHIYVDVRAGEGRKEKMKTVRKGAHR
jgi:hypothetical protein